MNCPNCKSEIPDNTKFCIKCGTSLRNEQRGFQQVKASQMAQRVSAYDGGTLHIPQMPIEIQLQQLYKKNKTLKIWVGVLVVTTVLSIFCWISTANDMNVLYSYEKERADEAEERLYNYENRSPVDETIDVIDSWLDIIW